MACAVSSIYVWFCLHHIRNRPSPQADPENPPTAQAPIPPPEPYLPPHQLQLPRKRSIKQEATAAASPRHQPPSTEFVHHPYPKINRPLPPRPTDKLISPYAVSPPYKYVNFPQQFPSWGEVKQLRQNYPRPLPLMGTRSLPNTSVENISVEIPECYV